MITTGLKRVNSINRDCNFLPAGGSGGRRGGGGGRGRRSVCVCVCVYWGGGLIINIQQRHRWMIIEVADDNLLLIFPT